jgi:hypothetical protein
MHEVLDGERIDEMLRWFVENEDGGAAGENERKEGHEKHTGDDAENDGWPRRGFVQKELAKAALATKFRSNVRARFMRRCAPPIL